MTDTIETLKAAAAELTARVAAFEKAQAQKAEKEPRQLSDDEWEMLEKEYHRNIPNAMNTMQCNAAARLRYCERELARIKDTTTVYGVPFAKAIEAIKGYDDAKAELARLREGLKVREGDVAQDRLDWWYTDVPVNDSQRMAREIQRHRKLVAK